MLQTTAVSIAQNMQTPRHLDIIRLWDLMFEGARKAVKEEGFTGVQNMPEIVGASGSCEAVNSLFTVDFFGRQAYLAQSDQLYLELLTPHLEKVYCEIQSFRKEAEVDDRHLCQFSLFEIEHQGNLDMLIDYLEKIIKSIYNTVADAVDEGLLKELHLDSRSLRNLSFDKITYTDAVTMMQKVFDPNLKWGDDLTSKHEAYLTGFFGPVFVTHYPKDIKFFNMRENDENPEVVNSCDMLLPFAGESTGAAERETEYDKIVHRLKTSSMYQILMELGGSDEDFEWYLQAHRDKEIPLHSGAGIGMARVAQAILKSHNIRECVPFVINRETLL